MAEPRTTAGRALLSWTMSRRFGHLREWFAERIVSIEEEARADGEPLRARLSQLLDRAAPGGVTLTAEEARELRELIDRAE